MTFACIDADDSETLALCQDCLRLLDWEHLIPSENDPPGLCPHCEGQTCHCGGCMLTAKLLAAGDYLNPATGLLRPDQITSWTPDGGAVFK